MPSKIGMIKISPTSPNIKESLEEMNEAQKQQNKTGYLGSGIYPVVIERIVDGDTVYAHINLGFGFWYIRKKIRIDGIDTPETTMPHNWRKLPKEKIKEYQAQKVRGIKAKNKLNEYLKIGSDALFIAPAGIYEEKVW